MSVNTMAEGGALAYVARVLAAGGTREMAREGLEKRFKDEDYRSYEAVLNRGERALAAGEELSSFSLSHRLNPADVPPTRERVFGFTYYLVTTLSGPGVEPGEQRSVTLRSAVNLTRGEVESQGAEVARQEFGQGRSRRRSPPIEGEIQVESVEVIAVERG